MFQRGHPFGGIASPGFRSWNRMFQRGFTQLLIARHRHDLVGSFLGRGGAAASAPNAFSSRFGVTKPVPSRGSGVAGM